MDEKQDVLASLEELFWDRPPASFGAARSVCPNTSPVRPSRVASRRCRTLATGSRLYRIDTVVKGDSEATLSGRCKFGVMIPQYHRDNRLSEGASA